MLVWNLHSAWRSEVHTQDRDAGPAPPEVPLAQPGQEASPSALLNRYCVACHNSRLRTAGLALDTMDPTRVGDDPAAWEKVVQKLRDGEPSIELRPGARDAIEVAVWMLQPGEAQIVAKRIREVLKAS